MIPSGCAVRDTSGDYWYVKSGVRYFIQSDAVYRSWAFPTTFVVSTERLEQDTTPGGRLGFRPGTMVYSLAHGGFWYISDKGRHRINDPKYFRMSGRSRFSLPMASRKDLELHEDLGVIE